jgi:hypothetical protein
MTHKLLVIDIITVQYRYVDEQLKGTFKMHILFGKGRPGIRTINSGPRKQILLSIRHLTTVLYCSVTLLI